MLFRSLGVAAELKARRMPAEAAALAELSGYFCRRVLDEIPEVRLNGHPKNRLPHILNFSFKGADSEGLLLHLDLAGIACSAGSACSAASLEPSHVLKAMDIPTIWNSGAVRFSLGWGNTKKDIDYTIEALKAKVEYLRQKRQGA